MELLENDIQNKNCLRCVVRFLKSGIIEDMKYYECDKVPPQGGLISSILANVYLHYLLICGLILEYPYYCQLRFITSLFRNRVFLSVDFTG